MIFYTAKMRKNKGQHQLSLIFSSKKRRAGGRFHEELLTYPFGSRKVRNISDLCRIVPVSLSQRESIGCDDLGQRKGFAFIPGFLS